MKCIHIFYYNDFKNYCLSNHLNPIDELQLRKTELSSIYSNKNISLIPLIIIGLASSLFMSYSLQKLSFLSDTTFLNLLIFTLGFIILSLGLLSGYSHIKDLKTPHPKEQLIKEYKLKIVSKLLEDYLRKI